MDVSFGTVWEGVARTLPQAIALSEPDRDFTYAQFEDRAARLAAALAQSGVGPGDKVACYLYNEAAYLETVFAAFKLGATPVNVNYRYKEGELTELLVDADASALVFGGALAGHVTHAARHVPSLRLLVRAGPATVTGPDAPDYEELLAATAPHPAEPRPGTDRLFMYTGGTTGRPKGVIWQLSDLLHCLTVPIFQPVGADTPPADVDGAVRIARSAHTRGVAPTTMPAVPLMHATGLFNSMGALLVGGRVVTARPGRLDAGHIWRTVADRRVGLLIVAGNAVCRPLVDELLAAERARSPHDLTALRQILSSGTALSDDLKRALHERTDVTITDAIAASEGGPVAFARTTSTTDLPARFFPVPAAKVLHEEGREVVPGSGETGFLAYSGPMPLGYHKARPEQSAAVFRTVGGVRHAIPGDLARVEADGSLRLLGRGSGVVNTGGEKVHPQEVEEVLLAHPAITDAAIVGIPDETWGERVAAVVATDDAGPLREQEVRDWVRATLAGYKVPRTVVVLPRLPRTPTGKLEVAWARRTVEEHEAHGAACVDREAGRSGARGRRDG